VSRPTMDEVRATYKRRDAWWTVLLVDPLAGPLVRLVAPYRWITPNVLTVVSFALGMGAAACFLKATTAALVLGAVLFHVSFVLDCMDGKLARLRRSFSIMGTWLDFTSDRIQFVVCVLALMAGQYLRTGRVVYLLLASVLVALGMLRYLHSAHIDQLEARVAARRAEAYQAAGLLPPEERAAQAPVEERVGSDELVSRMGLAGRVKHLLNRYRIRAGLVSAIEFEMAVGIIAPLTGSFIAVPLVAGVLLVVFESFFVYRLLLAVRGMERLERELGAGRHAAPTVPAPAVPAPAVPAPAVPTGVGSPATVAGAEAAATVPGPATPVEAGPLGAVEASSAPVSTGARGTPSAP
jgi:phosphatidylglycerophosphate synthase